MNYKIIAVFNDPENELFGNTSAVVMLDEPKHEEWMQQLASDFNQPATTFVWKESDIYHIRWFAPDDEIGLCGHGTLAAFAYINSAREIKLHYRDGVISGKPALDGGYSMEIEPIMSFKVESADMAIQEGINFPITEYFENNNKNIVVLEHAWQVKELSPDFSRLKDMKPFGVIVTAQGGDGDFVSRTLVPKVQQLEDHATGSSHAALTPFWSQRLNKDNMVAYQLSKRGGKFRCNYKNNKVNLTGNFTIVAQGTIL